MNTEQLLKHVNVLSEKIYFSALGGKKYLVKHVKFSFIKYIWAKIDTCAMHCLMCCCECRVMDDMWLVNNHHHQSWWWWLRWQQWWWWWWWWWWYMIGSVLPGLPSVLGKVSLTAHPQSNTVTQKITILFYTTTKNAKMQKCSYKNQPAHPQSHTVTQKITTFSQCHKHEKIQTCSYKNQPAHAQSPTVLKIPRNSYRCIF